MDSGNSGSLQSSSGGDEVYDSRATTISPFIRNSTAHVHVGPTSQPLISTQAPMFDSDSLSNYLQLQNQNSIFNPILSSFPSVDSFTTAQLPSDHNHNHQTARNPKKRSRASRRAPTTVLTTDTTNFRAMVQEFTGIPSPPFSSTIRSSSVGGVQPPYLRRPFPHKLHQPPPPPPPLFMTTASSSLLSLPQSSNLFTSLLESTMRLPIANSKAQDQLELVSSNDSHIKMGNYYNLLTNSMIGKMNNFDGEKEPESVAITTRGEGMVESWLCSNSSE